MISDDEFFDLSKRFDREETDFNRETKVIMGLHKAFKLRHITGIHDKGSYVMVTVQVGNRYQYYCVEEKKNLTMRILGWKEEIKKRQNPEDRWESWEVHGSENPREKMKQLLYSRSTKQERKELEKWL